MIELKEIFDDKIILSVLKAPCLFDRISSDLQTKESFVLFKKPDYLFLGIYDKNELVGMFFFHPAGNNTIQIHIQIFEKYRKEYAFDAGKMAVKWFIDSGYSRMIAEIPEIYMDVYNYTKKFGFVQCGINKGTYFKNGTKHDEFILELKREGAEKWVQSIK